MPAGSLQASAALSERRVGDPAHWRVLVGDMLIFLGHVWAFGESIALCLLRRGIVGSSH